MRILICLALVLSFKSESLNVRNIHFRDVGYYTWRGDLKVQERLQKCGLGPMCVDSVTAAL